ncbi:MAG: PAS domain S-box protein [Deltaproteobacteria bacterium]|nr:PAS domain S-box protein [Deltaproteobacteria bacterium]
MPTQPSLYPILKIRLKWLMVFRVVLVIIFLGTSIWFQFKQTSPFQSIFYPVYAIVIITCLLTILYSIIFWRVKDDRLFAYFQIFGDVFLVTATVYVTGGSESLLSFLYFLSIISASILLNRRGGFYAASASSIAYGLLANLDFYKALPTRYKVILVDGGYDRGDILSTVILNILGFFTVAFLTGYLAERTVIAEKELEEKKIDFKKLERLNKYVVEHINSGILTIDVNARITSFNKAAQRITGYNLREVYDRSIDMVFPDLMKTQGYSISSHEEESSYFRIDKPFKNKDGKELLLGLAVSPMRDGGRIVIFQDLTRIKKMEEQLRRVDRLRALGELVAGMSHEVRNPLASISGSAQVLKDNLMLDGDNKHLMEIIIMETDRLNALLTDFLIFAKPAAKMAEVDVQDIIHETINMFRNSPESKGIDIKAELDGKLAIKGDSRQLKQVFWNLFLNASHAMPDGGVLKIRGQGTYLNPETTESLNPDFVEITISDMGAGIPSDVIDKIFDPFFTTKDSGTGLGLAVAHRIIEGHDGKIEVTSEQGHGTNFKIILPMMKYTPQHLSRGE